MKHAYLVIGVPCSGKSWVCEQLKDRFEYVRHDDHISGDYLNSIVLKSATATKPLLIETPFSVSQIKDPLEKKGFNITPVFILETPEVLNMRYREREGTPIIPGHLTRQETYRQRAELWNSYRGTSEEVLRYLEAMANMEPAREAVIEIEQKWPWEKT
jgi:hypothetical protein